MASPFFDGDVWRDSATGAEVPNPGPFADPAHNPFVRSVAVPTSHDFTSPPRSVADGGGFWDDVLTVVIGPGGQALIGNPKPLRSLASQAGTAASDALDGAGAALGRGLGSTFKGIGDGLGLPSWLLPVGLGVLALTLLK